MSRSRLPDADAVIFDCDGVLVDVRESYEAAIRTAAGYALERFAGVSSAAVDSGIIEGFKGTGGFNDEVDLTYAAVLSLAAAETLGEEPRAFVAGVIAGADETGISSVERYLEGRADLSELRRRLGYPGGNRDSSLHEIFDQIFYGSEMYERVFSRKSGIAGAGLIERDVPIVSQDLLDALAKQVGGRLAVVTGRGLDSIRHSLGGMLDSFDLESCTFLEDEPRRLAKPNPEPLARAISGLSARGAMYVGDSMEDLIMAKRVSEAGRRTVFCGIVGTAADPEARRRMFERAGADIILDSIHEIPGAVRLG